jgi:hypothetical protein
MLFHAVEGFCWCWNAPGIISWLAHDVDPHILVHDMHVPI